MRTIQAANTEGLLRIIQSIPSTKAEPFKRWLAKVGRERIEETIDPEKAIDRGPAGLVYRTDAYGGLRAGQHQHQQARYH